MIFVLLGALLFAVGAIVSADIGGSGIEWREVRMSFYDRRSRGPDAYERNTRSFRLYHRVSRCSAFCPSFSAFRAKRWGWVLQSPVSRRNSWVIADRLSFGFTP